jgi:hypothetical protein
MHLSVNSAFNREIIHYASDDLRISSLYRKVFIERNGIETSFQLPGDGWRSVFAWSRLGRRALRLDKCNVIPVQDDLVIIRQGQVYHYDSVRKILTPTLKLKNCRNILHQSMLVTGQGELYFGEYGDNSSRTEVPIYRSRDRGRTWETIFVFPAGKIKHVHGCYWDPYEHKIWVFSGDFSGECYPLCADPDFKQVEWIGDGQQQFRMCNAFFEPDSIHWIMDSQLEDSYHIRMDRATRQIEKISVFPGPVWYIQKLTDGYYLAATAQEIGPGVHDQYAHLLVSTDLIHWEDILQFKHDGFPKRYFKFGVIGFADGPQSSQGFYLFGEALKNLDGRSLLCQIKT